jgi:hypothetical protein
MDQPTINNCAAIKSGLTRSSYQLCTKFFETELGVEFTERPAIGAFWLSCCLYCARHLTGGVIEGAGGWSERRWQASGIWLSEVKMTPTRLFRWDGNDLILEGYDHEGDIKYVGAANRGRNSAFIRAGGKIEARPSQEGRASGAESEPGDGVAGNSRGRGAGNLPDPTPASSEEPTEEIPF